MKSLTSEIAILRQARETARNQRPGRAVRICATGCRALGALSVYDNFAAALKKAGLEKEVALVKTGCQGICAGAPVVSIDPDELVYVGVQPKDAARIVRETLVKGKVLEDLCLKKRGKPVARKKAIPFFARQKQLVLNRCGRIDPTRIEDSLAEGAYEMLEKALFGMTSPDIIKIISDSGLRGRGGAGFPTGLKWKFAYEAFSEDKYVVCNGDEGDPGAFMDRAVLEGDPHAILEGMLICGYTINSSSGYIYVRAEYPIAIEHLELAISQARQFGLLGKNILGTGFNFDIQVMEGAGAFVCGEETALMASIEGKRGQPQTRPPYPAQSGLFGKPTNINNVETLASIPAIMRMGAGAYANLGTENSKGTKIFALAGKVNNTGLVEVPMGITLRDMVETIGGGIPSGKKFKAAQMGGPSGGCVPKKYYRTPIDYESLKELGAIMGSGGMIVMDESTCMVDIARYFMEFCAEESCGKCPPCRIGTPRILAILKKICDGEACMEDLEKLEILADQVRKNSLCGLGQTSANPVLSTLRHFRSEYKAHIKDKRCPAGVCKELISYDIDEKKCTACGRCAKSCPPACISGKAGKDPHKATKTDVRTGKVGTPFVINEELCIKCGSCLEICPAGAVSKG